MVQDWPALPLSVLGLNTEGTSGWANTGRRDWSPWPSQVPMGCLLVPGGMSIREGDMGRGGGCPSKGSPLAPHAVFPADAPSTHWTLRTSNRVPNLETKAGHCGQILMDIVNCISHPRELQWPVQEQSARALCAQLIIRKTKPGWVQGPRPAQRGTPPCTASRGCRLGCPPAGGPGAWGAVEDPALQPAASWGFRKYLPNKETAAFAFPVIVAPAPPRWVQAGEAQAPRCPAPLPPQAGAVRPAAKSRDPREVWTQTGRSGAHGPPLPQGPKLPPHVGTLTLCPDSGLLLFLVALGHPSLKSQMPQT
nr:uncharacterized protein LOC118971130 [Manis javanica]